jgi:protein phosphatase
VFEGYVIDKISHQNHRSFRLVFGTSIPAAALGYKKLWGVDLQQDKNAVEQFQLSKIGYRNVWKHDNLM